MARELISDHLQQMWLGVESTFGVATSLPVATDACDYISVDTAPTTKRVIPTADQTGNRGARAPIRGAFDPMALRVQMHLKGSGTAGTAPDFGDLLKVAGFSETISDGTDVTYARALQPDKSAWIWLAHRDGTMGRCYAGVVGGEVSLPDIGVDAHKIEFALTSAYGSVVYKTALGASMDNSTTSMTLPAGHGWVIGNCPAFVQVSEGETVEVMRVTALSGNTATVTRNADSVGAQTFTTAAVVKAYFPARTVTSAKPIGETQGSFTIDDGGGASGRKFVKAGLVMKTGVDLLDKEAFSENRQGLAAMRYGDDGARLTTDFIYGLGSEGVAYLHEKRNSGTSVALSLTIGSTAGNRCLVTIPAAQVVDLSAPDAADGPRKGTVIFGAYSDDGQDLTIKFN